MKHRLADNFLHFKDSVVVVREEELDRLMEAYNVAAECVKVVKCGKCGKFHNEMYICPNCGNDPDDEEYPCEVPDLEITILDRNHPSLPNSSTQ